MPQYSNWQLAFFSVPDAAQFFVQGRERQMLSWYFLHAGYAATSAVSDALLTLYTDAISKPGYLRAGFEYFSNPTVAQDAAFFNATLVPAPFAGKALVMGGEASVGIPDLLRRLFAPVLSDFEIDVVPKAGHWIGNVPTFCPPSVDTWLISVADENPVWLAHRIAQFLQADDGIPALDLAYLDNRVTLQGPVI